MKDEAIRIAPCPTDAQAAILYVLTRCQLDLNLRHYMVHTEAFTRLCDAEAKRTGEDLEVVEDRFSQPKREGRADIVKARELFHSIRQKIELNRKHGDHAAVVAAIDELLYSSQF
jgi:hypothetical protein